VSLLCLSDVHSLTLGLSTKLQTVGIDFFVAKIAVIDVIVVLTKRREAFDNFDNIFTFACHLMEMLDVPVTNNKESKKSTESAGPNAKRILSTDCIYLPLLDAITMHSLQKPVFR